MRRRRRRRSERANKGWGWGGDEEGERRRVRGLVGIVRGDRRCCWRRFDLRMASHRPARIEKRRPTLDQIARRFEGGKARFSSTESTPPSVGDGGVLMRSCVLSPASRSLGRAALRQKAKCASGETDKRWGRGQMGEGGRRTVSRWPRRGQWRHTEECFEWEVHRLTRPFRCTRRSSYLRKVDYPRVRHLNSLFRHVQARGVLCSCPAKNDSVAMTWAVGTNRRRKFRNKDPLAQRSPTEKRRKKQPRWHATRHKVRAGLERIGRDSAAVRPH